MAQIRSKPFGVTKEGANVTEYILSNPGGMSVSVLDYGCVIKNIIVPAKNGPVDVVLGHDTMADYENDFTSSGSTCCGAFVGRYANRIENAVFTLGGKTYQLEKNNGENHLHGCFSRKIYEVKYFGDTLLMEAVSPDGEDGFPGTLKIAVRYTLTDDNTFRMDYRVSSDADTIVNLTNHSYFNLDGGGDVLNQKLRIYASRYLEGNIALHIVCGNVEHRLHAHRSVSADLHAACKNGPALPSLHRMSFLSHGKSGSYVIHLG